MPAFYARGIYVWDGARRLRALAVARSAVPLPPPRSMFVWCKQWTFHTADRAHIVLMGADIFPVWKNVKVAINYRATGANAGDCSAWKSSRQ